MLCKKNLNNGRNIFYVLAAAIAVSALGCTKKLDYDYVAKSHVESKSMINTNAQYLYVPTTGNASRTGLAARPYQLGEGKLVKFKFTEDSLQVLEVDQDKRFQDNATNQKLVMSIPVEHLEYRCARDKYGECTEKEEEDKYKPWNERSQFKPSFDKIKITETNTLPMEFEKALGSSCYEEKSAQFVGYQLEQNALNFQIEKTFSVKPKCASNLEDDLSVLTVVAIFHYSFVAIDTVATPKYQAIVYPQKDEGDFGFFTNDVKKLDADFGDTVQSKTTLMSRWNPNKEVLTYYLSKEFEKPENAALKKATYKGVEKINKGLEAAGVKFRVDLKPADGRIPGDIRYNFIIMVEDPIASNVLGYGPRIADPRTGEIISARTVMYPGVMKQFVRWTYDEILRSETKKAEAAKMTKGQTFALSPEMKSQLSRLKKAQLAKTNPDQELLSVQVPPKATAGPAPLATLSIRNSSVKPQLGSQMINIKEIKDMVLGKKMAVKKANTPEDRISDEIKGCFYPAELFNFDLVVATALKEKLKGESLQPWEKLSEDEKQAAIDVILPAVWVPTFVHEMGHNLGLRHNFKGSEDKKNFYTKSELAAAGVQQDIPYSSVMDYPYSDLNMLPTMGKYDIAALRFAYLRQVEDVNGNWISVPSTLENLQKENAQLQLKDYAYCSDEQVEVNTGCKRFDEGTNLTEMVKHGIKSYKESFERSHFRRNRRNFSLNGDATTAAGLLDRMQYLRFNFESMGRLKERLPFLTYDHPDYNQSDFLKEIKQAAIESGKFLTEILLIPDKTCILADSRTNTLVTPVLLKHIAPYALTCEGIEFENSPQIVVGEFGENFNSKKDPNSNNPYADQIDQRGLWVSKVAALHTLLDRSIDNSSWDKTDDNYLDLPEVRDDLIQALADLMNGSNEQVINVTLFNGQKIEMPVHADLGDSQKIANPLSDSVKKMLAMPDRDSYLQELMLPILKKSTMNRSQRTTLDRSVSEGFSVTRINSLTPIVEKGPDGQALNVSIWKLDGTTTFVAAEENIVGRQLIQKLQVNETLGQFNPSEVRAAAIKLIKGDLAKLDPSTTTAVEKAVLDVGVELVTAYLTGGIQDSDFLGAMLELTSR